MNSKFWEGCVCAVIGKGTGLMDRNINGKVFIEVGRKPVLSATVIPKAKLTCILETCFAQTFDPWREC
jgi:hypothetical protein